MKKARTLYFLLSLIIIICAQNALSAQQKDILAALPDAQVKERLTFIENSLYTYQPNAQAWWYSWISVYTAATVVQESLAGVHWSDWRHDHHPLYTRRIRNRAFAEDMMVGGFTTFFGLAGQLVFPFKPAYLPDQLRPMPDGTPGERLAKLKRAEDILRQCAESEEDGWGWLNHVLNIVVNAGAGLTTVFAFKRPWTDGLITFAEGEAVSLLNIFTQPRFSIKNLRKYNERYAGGAGGYDPYENEIFFSFYGTGIGIGMKF